MRSADALLAVEVTCSVAAVRRRLVRTVRDAKALLTLSRFSVEPIAPLFWPARNVASNVAGLTQLRLDCRRHEKRSIHNDIRDLRRDDKMVLGVDSSLHVVLSSAGDRPPVHSPLTDKSWVSGHKFQTQIRATIRHGMNLARWFE